MKREDIFELIYDERVRQTKIGNDQWDDINSRNDFIAYMTAYLGHAAQKVYRKEREGCEYRDNLIKVAALVVAALEQD
jgi:hypothetical protein